MADLGARDPRTRPDLSDETSAKKWRAKAKIQVKPPEGGSRRTTARSDSNDYANRSHFPLGTSGQRRRVVIRYGAYSLERPEDVRVP